MAIHAWGYGESQSGRKGVRSGLSRSFFSVLWYNVASRYTIQNWKKEKKLKNSFNSLIEFRFLRTFKELKWTKLLCNSKDKVKALLRYRAVFLVVHAVLRHAVRTIYVRALDWADCVYRGNGHSCSSSCPSVCLHTFCQPIHLCECAVEGLCWLYGSKRVNAEDVSLYMFYHPVFTPLPAPFASSPSIQRSVSSSVSLLNSLCVSLFTRSPLHLLYISCPLFSRRHRRLSVIARDSCHSRSPRWVAMTTL